MGAQLLPYGISVAMALVALWAAKQFFGEFFKQLGTRTSERALFSRGRGFTRRRLRRYRQSIEDDFKAHRPGFTGDTVIDINQVYVPLQSEQDGTRQDIYEDIREQRRSVVIGAAGAGKSLLLKNSMLMWARSRFRRQIPVLIELHRCNSSPAEIIDLVVDELGRSRVHRRSKPERDRLLAEKALEDGRLTVLLDGLDEVGRDEQDRVARSIRDFARRYRDCQIIVTCRDVVYQGQLAPEFTHVIRVAEFDDAGILRLLGNWPGIAGTPTVAEIFGILQKNPAMMRLARSPLLLTMIAYLHVEVFSKTGRRLPTSRSAFYDQAITHLLGRDADLGRSKSLAVYDVGEKKAVLQRVALSMLASRDADRRTIAESTLKAVAQDLLPDLNLQRTDVKPMLHEIVDRSQLLVAVDDARFMFRHLTLQEYLAAAELADDPDRLLELYRTEPLAWRETVKLWCGSSTRDCTKVVAEIFSASEPHHRILALECLAEAKRIDNEFAELIINYFTTELGKPWSDRSAVIKAFGTVAADSRPRGQAVLDLLIRAAQAGILDAMHALAASGRLEAAEALAPLAQDDGEARQALRSMGELAVPALEAQATAGNVWAVDDLGVIGTPSAAVALGRLLWSGAASATRAAWRLAELLRNPDVEDALRDAALPASSQFRVDWVWEPFALSKKDPLLTTAGRVVWLLQRSIESDTVPVDVTTIDPRLGIPMAVTYCDLGERNIKLTDEQLRQTIELIQAIAPNLRVSALPSVPLVLQGFFKAASKEPYPTEKVQRLCALVADLCRLDQRGHRLLGMLSWPVQATIFRTVLLRRISGSRGKLLRKEDWTTVRAPRRKPVAFRWARRILLIPILAGVFVVGAVRTTGGAIGMVEPIGPGWLSLAALICFGVAATSVAVMAIRNSDNNWTVYTTMILGVASVIVMFGIGMDTAREPPELRFGLFMVAFTGVLLGMIADHRERANANPFAQCLEASSIQINDRTSVIAS